MCFFLIEIFKNHLSSFFFFFILVFRHFLEFFFLPFSRFKKRTNLQNAQFTSRYFFFFLKKNAPSLYFLDWLFSCVYFFSYSAVSVSKYIFRDKQKNSVRMLAEKSRFDLSLPSFIFAFKSFWFLFRFWILGFFLFLLFFYYLTYIRSLPFNKVIFEWFLICMFVYWLVSGFVFFFKKYQFSKYTSVIQRFWKRTYILFWLIESGVFLVFFYLTLNASEEPVFMYDQIKLYKTHLFSWRNFIQKLVPLLSLIVIGYLIQLNIKWGVFSRVSFFIIVLTLLILFIVWLEFYQFFHIVSFYGNLSWNFNYDEFTWNLDHEFRRTRIANNYVSICLMAKFWHMIFIFVFWIFFALRVNETKRVRYPLFAANTQNFIILYIMSWLYMYPWLKFIFRGFLDNSYFWFFLNSRSLSLRIFFHDFKYFFSSVVFKFNHSSHFFSNFDFFYWIESSDFFVSSQFKKHSLRDFIISSIKN